MIDLRRVISTLVVPTVLVPAAAAATAAVDERVLSLEEALSLARDRAPVIRAARAGIEEARGRLTGASIRMGGNPILEADVGRRTSGDEDFTDFELGFTQPLGVAGRRGARMAGAQADLDAARADTEETSRGVLLQVAEAFLRALHATQRHKLAAGAAELTEGIARSAERRYQAGDVAVIDVNVSSGALARARSAALAAASDLGEAAGVLKALLDLDAEELLSVQGELERRIDLDLAALLEGARSRPDLRAAAARVDQAEAEGRAAGTMGRPGFDVGVRYEQEAEDDIVLGLMSVTLPSFDRGQGVIAEAGARAARLRLERESLQRAVATEVTAAFTVYQQRKEAADLIGRSLPMIAETEALVGRSYDAGQIGLVEMLVLRRDALETRMAHADRQLEAALAAVRLEAAAGRLP